jgi:hypothetical protein
VETPREALAEPVSHLNLLNYTIHGLTHTVAHEPDREHIRIDMVSEDPESTRDNQTGESEGRKESKREMHDILDQLLRETRALQEEVARMYGDTASIVSTMCGDTALGVNIGVSRSSGRCSCSFLCYRRGSQQILDPNQSSQSSGVL